jgi:hypothetical protein
MLELILVLPLFLVLLMSAVQVTEIIAARLATGWAARLAARAAAVHLDADPDRKAELAALHALAPFLHRQTGFKVPPAGPAYRSQSGTAKVGIRGRGWAQGESFATELRIAFQGGGLVAAEAARKRIHAGEPASAEVHVAFDMPLRIPLAGRFFTNTDRPGVRRLQARARFPVQAAGGEQ